MTEIDWSGLISRHVHAPVNATAHTFVKAWSTASRPALVACDDGRDWVIKGRQSGKQAVTDQVLGTIGRQLGCPIPLVGQVLIPPELISSEPALSHIPAGRAHGSLFQAGYTEREALSHAMPENAAAFAALACFYGLGLAQDQQFIYRVEPPPLVMSVDHGHFIGGGNWDEASLGQLPTEADLDASLVAHAAPSPGHLQESLKQLRALTDDSIARAVALPGDDWAFSHGERVALATLLSRRRDSLVRRLEERLV